MALFIYKGGVIRARPKTGKYDNLVEKLNKYTDETEIPIIAEFAHINGFTRDYLYTLSKNDVELFNAIKRCTESKEIALERGALKGKYDKTMAIFSLKQLGWRDKVETESKVEFSANPLIEAINKAANSGGKNDFVEE